MYATALSAIAAALALDAQRNGEAQRLTYSETTPVKGVCILYGMPGIFARQTTRLYTPDAKGCIETDTYTPAEWEVL